jgi:acetoin utilization protein AcuB
MKIKDWMTTKVVTVSPEASVRTAFATMKRHGFRHLPVVRDGRLVGVVTDRDLRRPDISDVFKEWDDLYRLGEDISVEDVMTVQVVTVTPETDLLTAASMLVEKRIGALPVVEEDSKLVGIVTTIDLLKAFVRNASGEEYKTRKKAVLPA